MKEGAKNRTFHLDHLQPHFRMPKKPFYITTTLPYVNAEPHIGFAMELIRADIIARYKRSVGCEVFFNTGTDEHGLKIFQAARQANKELQTYVDEVAQRFKDLVPALGIADHEEGIEFSFTRTTDPRHVAAAAEFWKIVDKGGYIYKKNYSVKYCVGCELEKTESELVNGRCPLHPLQELETIQEENYFFKFSAFRDKLLDLYKSTSSFVIPESRLKEIRAFVERGLEDFSISRLASKMPWGVPVPGDDTQVMYVWFDALVNYISAIGWPDEEFQGKKIPGSFQKWWIESGGAVQYCGKDNLRQQSAMWQAMLMAAGLPNSETIVVDGFITGEGGVKMSKSLGNTVNPLDIVKEYGAPALRYYVARELSPFEDSPFTTDKFKESYNANLANGLGNLVSRVLKMSSANAISHDVESDEKLVTSPEMEKLHAQYEEGLQKFNIQLACNAVWEMIAAADKIVQEREPFKKIKDDREAAITDIKELLSRLNIIAGLLLPIMPETVRTIEKLIKENKMPEVPLFARK